MTMSGVVPPKSLHLLFEQAKGREESRGRLFVLALLEGLFEGSGPENVVAIQHLPPGH